MTIWVLLPGNPIPVITTERAANIADRLPEYIFYIEEEV